MKYWERLLRSIFKLAAGPLVKKIKPKSIESVLKDSLLLLNNDTIEEIRNFIRQKQTIEGGFADRAGKSDLYYSMFGYFIAEAFSVQGIIEPLKMFVKKEVTSKDLSGVHLFCAAILYAKLFEPDNISISLERKINLELKSSPKQISKSANQHIEYATFMGFLALYYLENYLSVYRLIKTYKGRPPAHQLISASAPQPINRTAQKSSTPSAHQPCTVAAADAILSWLSGYRNHLAEEKLKSYCQTNGGFLAVRHAPCPDLLSTGVALYALTFMNSDIRLIKPQCIAFVDDLYDEGGFRATQIDFETDVEYTFYGLLALGSLK